jgi:hypothetical protein
LETSAEDTARASLGLSSEVCDGVATREEAPDKDCVWIEAHKPTIFEELVSLYRLDIIAIITLPFLRKAYGEEH